jgi:hypothetical protein
MSLALQGLTVSSIASFAPCIMLLLLLLQGLKATGSYLARTLSYHGAEFTMADVQLSPQMRCVRSSLCCVLFLNLFYFITSFHSLACWLTPPHQRMTRLHTYMTAEFVCEHSCCLQWPSQLSRAAFTMADVQLSPQFGFEERHSF